jgi:hypothetical protein
VQIKADICAVASRLRDFEEFGSVVLIMSLVPKMDFTRHGWRKMRARGFGVVTCQPMTQIKPVGLSLDD